MTAILRDGVGGSGGSSSAAATIPSTILAGDLMILVVTFKAATGGASITTPAGWTPLAAAVNMTGGTGQARAYVRRSDGTEGGTTLTVVGVGATQQIDWVLAAYSGAGGIRGTIVFTDQGVTAATAIPCAAGPAGPDDLTLAIASTRGSVNGGYTFTAPAGYNVDQQITSTATAQDAGAVICSGTAAAAQTITASIAVWAISGQIIIAGTLPPTSTRRARPVPRPRRAQITPTPPAQVIPAPPTWVPQTDRARVKALARSIRGRSTNVPTHANAMFHVKQRPRWPWPLLRRRGTATPTPPAQVAPVVGVYIPSRPRPNGLHLLPARRRGRATNVPIGQHAGPALHAPARRRRFPQLPRHRGAQVVPPQVNPPHPVPPPPGRRGLWRLIDWTRRRHRPAGVPAPATVTPPPIDDLPFDTDPPSLGWDFGALTTTFDTDDLHN